MAPTQRLEGSSSNLHICSIYIFGQIWCNNYTEANQTEIALALLALVDYSFSGYSAADSPAGHQARQPGALESSAVRRAQRVLGVSCVNVMCSL